MRCAPSIIPFSKRKSYSTRGRRDLLDALSSHRKPLTAKSLHELVGRKAMDLATIHRSLKHFIRTGLVNEVFAGGLSRRYEISEGSRHHHHVSCTSCGDVEDIPTCRMGALTRYAEKEKGYEIHSHSFELFGLCPACRHKPGGKHG